MNVNKHTIRELVREIMSEMDESDLLVKNDNRTWAEMSNELKIDVDKLIQDISTDKYVHALDDISSIAATMKIWKHRIIMGGAGKKKGSEEYDMKRFNLAEEQVESSAPTREELANALSLLLKILDEERAYKSKDYKYVPDSAMQTYANMQHARKLLSKMNMNEFESKK